jgi:hypothetical protein
LSTAPDALEIIRITPDRWRTMCRAAARAVTKSDRAPTEMGRMKSSTSISRRGALNVAAGDQVEAHVHRAALIDHGPYVIVDRSVVESVDHRHVRSPAVRVDLGGDAVEGLTGPARNTVARSKAIATSPPIPRAAPWMIAFLFCRSLLMSPALAA